MVIPPYSVGQIQYMQTHYRWTCDIPTWGLSLYVHIIR